MEKGLIKENFPVLDMTCAACAARVDKALNKSKGVRCASVNLASNMATVEYDPAECSPEALKKAVVDAGYDLVIGRRERGEDELEKEHARKMKAMKRKLVFSIVFSIPVFVISMFFPDMPYGGYVMLVLSGAVLVWPAGGIFAGAFRLLKHFSSNMDTLVATSTGVAYVFSAFNLFFPDFWLSKGVEPHLYFDASSMVVTFILLGRWLEERAKGKASSAIRELMGLRPDTVGVLGEDSEIRVVPIGQVKAGDIVVVRPGERIAVDGSVIKGDSYVDESMLNGEPLPSHKYAGEKVFAGSVNGRGSLYFKAEKVGEGTLLSRIISLVRDAQGSKAPVQRLVDKIASVFVPVIIGIAVLSAVVWLIADPSEGMTHALLAFVTVLVIACPCALGLATPTAIMVGVGKAARNGVLVKDAQSIEIAKKTDVIVLDKTGTITEGSMQVEKTHIYSTKFGHVDDIMTNMVAALGAQGSTFEAFAQYFKSSEKYDVVSTVPFSSSRKWSAADFGAVGKFIVGAPEFVLKERYSLVENDVKEYSAQGFRVLVLVRTTQPLKDDLDRERLKPIALIVLSDKIRENAKDTLAYFAKQGVELKVISGDNPLTVSKVAERAGLANADKFIDATELDTDEKIYEACDKYTIFGRVTPKQKKVLVTSLKSKGHTVGMTGDGVNDVMALKEADCSIAMASGSEASRNVAQLVLLDSDFAALPSVVAEGRRVINNIERAASLFLVKTSFSILLTLLLIILQMNYPFEPIQLTLISGLFVGLPSFFLAIEPNDSKVRGSFLSKVFKKALPAGFTVATMVTIICLVYRNVGIDVSAQVSTMAFYVTSLVSFIVLMWVCIPYTKERLYLIAMCLVLYIAAITSSFIRNILSISGLTTEMTINIVFMLLAVFPMIIFWRAEIGAFNSLVREIKDFRLRVKEYWDELRGKRQDKKDGKPSE